MPDIIEKYFPLLTTGQKEKLASLRQIYERWNTMINVISRKDMENFMIHHVLHSLAIAKTFNFDPGTQILDVGTGGGFPGIPLAIVFPGSHFTLLDSIGKKIKVASSVSEELNLENVTVVQKRAEDEKGKYDFVISRAVTEFGAFIKLVSKNIHTSAEQKNGIICLKGGEIAAELGKYTGMVKVWNIGDFFEESFFETKKIILLPF